MELKEEINIEDWIWILRQRQIQSDLSKPKRTTEHLSKIKNVFYIQVTYYFVNALHCQFT